MYDGSQVIAEQTATERSTWYVWSGSSLLQSARVLVAGGSVDKLNLHQDRIGNVVLATRLNGSTVEMWGRLQFDPYGRKVSNITWEDHGVHVPYRFAGQRLDPDTGLYLMGARWYSAELGRFIEQDPIAEGGGLNLYAYTGSSPTMWVDPSGLRQVNPAEFNEGRMPTSISPFDSVKGGGRSDTKVVMDGMSLSDPLTGETDARMVEAGANAASFADEAYAHSKGFDSYDQMVQKFREEFRTQQLEKGKDERRLIAPMSQFSKWIAGKSAPPPKKAEAEDPGKSLEGLPGEVQLRKGEKVVIYFGGEHQSPEKIPVLSNARELKAEAEAIVGEGNVDLLPLDKSFSKSWNAMGAGSVDHVIIVGHNLGDGVKGTDGSTITPGQIAALQPGKISNGGSFTWAVCNGGMPNRTNSVLQASAFHKDSRIFGSTTSVTFGLRRDGLGYLEGDGITGANWISRSRLLKPK